ncbi:XRE family transcriptional regulator, partial [Mesorhizobium sp. M7A.F.Ca.US.001.01.1.1]
MIVPNEILYAARAALGISRPDLAKLTGLGERTILRLESNERVTVRTLQRVQAALEAR